MGEPRRRLGALQPIENLTEERRLRPFAALRGHFALFVFVFRVTDDATRLFDAVVDHRHDGVIGDTALARTVIVQHVAGPKPALLHALPRQNSQGLRCIPQSPWLVGCVSSARSARFGPLCGPRGRRKFTFGPHSGPAQITVQEGWTLTWCPGANLHHRTARCRNLIKEQPDGLRRRTRGRYSVAAALTLGNQNRAHQSQSPWSVKRKRAESPTASVSYRPAPGGRRRAPSTAASCAHG